MSVSLRSEALEMRLEGVREATSRVSALIHWLTLPEHIRKTLEECFPDYSPAERKLIVDLSETFGAKAVHDAFGIAYDTVSRLKKRCTEDLDRKPRVPLKYMLVLDLMHKHPDSSCENVSRQ